MQGFIDSDMPMEILPELNEISWGGEKEFQLMEEGNRYYQYDQRMTRGIRIGMKGRLCLNTNENEVLICMHGMSI